MKPLFITGIGTDVGKTIIAAILVEKLQADYWKPIQSGELNNTDTDKIKQLVSNSRSVFHPEAYRLNQAFSPHKSAALDGIKIDTTTIALPKTANPLVIEGAGGLMVPINDKHYIIDLIKVFEAEVILVVQHYLGSINHTLLSLEILKIKGIPVKGIIFNGESDSFSEKAILNYSPFPVLGYIPFIENVSKEKITNLGNKINWA
ncbi:MAG: dethiobiotin synthase [Pyrinomonadaceae bacterium]|nr:dethiobiotin synthase [Sphingobacteriaceae bacterium]